MLGNEQNNNQTEERLQSSRAKIDITDYFAKYNESCQKIAKRIINGYYRAISLEGIRKTQGTITVDSLEGKDNIETLCEYIFERANNKYMYYSTYESHIRGLYDYQQAINENIRNPFKSIHYKKLYEVIDERVQAIRDQGGTPDKNEIITEVLTAIDNGEIDVRRPVEFDITNDFVSRYQSEKYANTNKTYINQYLRTIFPEVTNDTQRAITADSLEGKDNIETICEYVYGQINLKKNYDQNTKSVILRFYAFLNGINENIRNPIEYISLQKLYNGINEIVQNNNNLDKDEVIKQVMKGIYGGTLDVCINGEKATIYERLLYKRSVITDKFVSSRNGDVSKEERKKFEEWLIKSYPQLDLRYTNLYIDKYEEGKKQNFNKRKRPYSPRHEDNQRQKQRNVTTKVSNVQKNNLALQEITLEVPSLANNNLIQITAYKIPNTDVIVDCNNVQLMRKEGKVFDKNEYQLFLNNDGHLVTREGYYPIPITHPFAAIIGKHGYTMGPLGDEKLSLHFAPNENAVQFWEGTYKQPILVCVDRNGIYDSLDNKIIVEKGQDGKIRITYPNEAAAYEKTQSMIANQGNDGVFINGPVPTYGMYPYYQSLNGQDINPSAPIQTQNHLDRPSTSTRFVQHNNG